MGTTGIYDRLLAWAAQGRTLAVDRIVNPSGSITWTIAVTVADPVHFSAKGRGKTVEEAASEVIEQLESVGVDVP